MSMTREVTLSTLARGGLEERLQAEVGRVVENVNDPNCEAEVLRQITIKLRFKPDKSRTTISMSGTVETKLAAGTAIMTTLFCGVDGGRYVVREHDARQTMLDFHAEQGEDDFSGKSRN